LSNASYYQRNYWFEKIANKQHGEFCLGCGISKDSNWKNKKFTGLVLDKINNNGNHTIADNTVNDFQLLCISCNHIKNPIKDPNTDLEMTQSEKTNKRAEKPLMEWLMSLLRSGKIIKWSWFVAEGSFKFDISPETIERRYLKKYFQSDSSPFEFDLDTWQQTIIILKNRDNPKTQLDINPHTPTPSILKKDN